MFTVDLFNEGVDLPDVDTLLLLRPTSSATVFLQQLGRGLRRTPGKAVLTVLDFIGQHRREYRFDLRYRALTGTSRSRLRQEIEHGFPFLPSGSQLLLDRVARDIVLDNVHGALSRSRRELVADLRSHGDLPLAEFLSESGRELADIYGRPGQSWTGLRRAAGLATLPAGPDEDAVLRRMVALSHVNDQERSALYTRLAAVDGPSYGPASLSWCSRDHSQPCPLLTTCSTSAAVPMDREYARAEARHPWPDVANSDAITAGSEMNAGPRPHREHNRCLR